MAARGAAGASERAGSTYPELVRSQLVDVGPGAGDRLVPETELQQQLIPAGEQHPAALLPVISKHLAGSTSSRFRFRKLDLSSSGNNNNNNTAS